MPRLDTRTRVVFFQHPREARVPIGTARMAHLALPNSELHVGVSFAGVARLAALAADPDTAVLYPDGPGGAGTPARPPRTLIVVDGTWPQARKLIRKNPILAGLPRIGLRPARPGAYRIRREPTPDCLATVEAVAAVLGDLEGDSDRFAALLGAFTFMVEQQIACAKTTPRPRRRAGWKGPSPLGPELAALHLGPGAAVLLHAEANAQGKHERTGGAPELVHLVAIRPTDGVRFEAIIRPRRQLGARTPQNLDLSRAQLLEGEPITDALTRLRAFLRADDRPCGWGPFAADLLASEGLRLGPIVDLRAVFARRMPELPGGPERAAVALGAAPASAWAAGRAGRMISAIESLFAALLARMQPI